MNVAPRARRWLGSLALLALMVAANHERIPLERYEQTYDVQNIKRPLAEIHSFADSLRWWTGSLAHDGIRDYRPLTSYLFWSYRLAFGDRYDLMLWPGYFIFGGMCIQLFLFNARLVRSHFFAWCGATLLAVPCFWNSDTQTGEWLAWYPGHPTILCGMFAATALLTFDVWLERASAGWLAVALAANACAMLTWGAAIVLPPMLALLVWHRRDARPQLRARVVAVLAAVLVCGTILLLRHAFVPGARAPLINGRLVFKALLHCSGQYALYLGSGSRWPALLALTLAGGCAAWSVARGHWLWKSALLVGLCCVVTAVGGESPLLAAATLFEIGGNANAVRTDIIYMTLWAWSAVLMWRHRRDEPAAMAYAMVVLSLLPTAQYTGWHYRLMPLFWWGLVYAISWKCWWRWLSERFRQISAPGLPRAIRAD